MPRENREQWSLCCCEIALPTRQRPLFAPGSFIPRFASPSARRWQLTEELALALPGREMSRPACEILQPGQDSVDVLATAARALCCLSEFAIALSMAKFVGPAALRGNFDGLFLRRE